MNNNVFEELKIRGLIDTNTPGLDQLLASSKVAFYSGYDPTADSLHVGHLVVLRLHMWLALAGHPGTILIGDGTAAIGDPTGRSSERQVLALTAASYNGSSIRGQIERLLASSTAYVVNSEWINSKNYSVGSFMTEIGSLMPLGFMLGKDAVRSRIESELGITYAEFSYMLLQAWDYLRLAESGRRLQIGGSDQWGNITAGIELGRRRKYELHGLTCPLLLDRNGQKMGKTSAGDKIWLSGQQTSPYKFYQFWMNRTDDEIEKILPMLSMQDMEVITAILDAHRRDPNKRVAQRSLARELTTWVHSKESARHVEIASNILFGAERCDLSQQEVLNILSKELPLVFIPRATVKTGITVVDLLVSNGLCETKTAAKRLIEGGGAYLNEERLDDNIKIGEESAHFLLRAGKTNYLLCSITTK